MEVNENTTKKNYRALKIILLILAMIALIFGLVYGAVMITSGIIYNRIDAYSGPHEGGSYPMSRLDTEKFFWDDYNFLGYEDENYTYMRGIDVSAFQHQIEWEKVKDEGVEYAMIRVGYRGSSSGLINEDFRFKENIQGALDNGIKVGVYFFSQAVTTEEAVEEARYVIDMIKGYDVTMPICFDMEPVEGDADRIAKLSMSETTMIADAFCRVIVNHGYKPIIYGNPTWLYNHINPALITDWEIWLAYYGIPCTFPYEYTSWQYSCTGTIEGIDGYVDLNIMLIERE